MTFSRRRLEFLRALREITASSGAPVHYAEVASRLGVSKWTGYDMMQELLSDGLVRASYSTASSGFRGRSQVLFEPTQEGLELLQLDAGAGVDGTVGTSARADSADVQGEWGETSESLLRRARAALESKSDLKSILAGFRDASPLSFCAALLAVLVVESRRSGLSLLTAEAVLEAGAEPGVALAVLVGVLAGELLVRGAFKAIQDGDRQIKRFVEETARMEDHAKGLLADFARSVISLGSKA